MPFLRLKRSAQPAQENMAGSDDITNNASANMTTPSTKDPASAPHANQHNDGLLSPPTPSFRPPMSGRTGSVVIQRMSSYEGLDAPTRRSNLATTSENPATPQAESRKRAITISVPQRIRRTFTPQFRNDNEDEVELQRPQVEQNGQSASERVDEHEEEENRDDGDTRATGWAQALGLSRVGRSRAGTTATRGTNGGSAITGRRRGYSTASRLSHNSVDYSEQNRDQAYDTRVHDLLDAIDPEVQMLNTLGDIQNSLFVPYTGFFDRTRKINLTKPPQENILSPSQQAAQDRVDIDAEQAADNEQEDEETRQKKKQKPMKDVTGAEKDLPAPPQPPPTVVNEDGTVEPHGPSEPVDTETTLVATEVVVKGKYFVLPSRLVDMSDWTEQEKADLDDYVRHLLHNRKERLRRKWRGFKKYVSTPLGAFVTIYATLLGLWGTAWFLFLLGWIPVGDRQAYFVEICDQILVALFCVTGLGLIPFRSKDTYHAYFIIKYHNKTLKLRKKRGLPKLADRNDLPNDQMYNHDLERAGHAQDAVLSDEEQALLAKHQTAFQKSHTYYRPHETPTHHAFSLRYLIAIIILSDFHSIFQLALGTTTWSISYHRHFKSILTSVILGFSLSCNITSGVLIAAGNKVSRKTEVVEALMRKAITEEAIRRREDAIAYKEEKRLEREKALQRSRRQSSDGGALSRVTDGALSVEKIMNLHSASSEKDGNNEKKRSNTTPTRQSSDSRRKLVGSRQSTTDTSSSSTLQN